MSEGVWGNKATEFFYTIGPEQILASVDQVGFRSTGRIYCLNSLENRVYQVEIEPAVLEPEAVAEQFVVIKFYRPGRWSEQQIREEHQFLLELQEAEIPVIAPLCFQGESLFPTTEVADGSAQIYFSIFPRRGGRAPEELTPELLQRLGRTLGRMHVIGRRRPAPHRLMLNAETYGLNHLNLLQQQNLLPAQIADSYATAVRRICEKTQLLMEHVPLQRVHGDCHRGNILSRPEGLFLLDFDDMVMGPCVQDLWPLILVRGEEAREWRQHLLEGYEEFCDFDDRTWNLVEPLRALRFIHFAAWIGKRFEDPAFKKHFYWYGTEQYWREQLQDLEDQLELIKILTNQ